MSDERIVEAIAAGIYNEYRDILPSGYAGGIFNCLERGYHL